MKNKKDCNDSDNWSCALVIVAYLAMLTILILTGHYSWAIGLIVGPPLFLMLIGGGRHITLAINPTIDQSD